MRVLKVCESSAFGRYKLLERSGGKEPRPMSQSTGRSFKSKSTGGGRQEADDGDVGKSKIMNFIGQIIHKMSSQHSDSTVLLWAQMANQIKW